ncbi:MAG: EAL domain-containing protein [Gammaproteobacteria bacterium]
MGLLVLLAAVSGHYLLTHSREQAAQHIDNRQRLLAQSRAIRDSVWQAREAIGQFLIDPDRKQNQDRINDTIASAMKNTQRLLAMHPRLNPKQLSRIEHVAQLTQQLQKAANQLIKIRLDSNLEFPSLVLARDEMLPRQQLVFDAFATALQETADKQANDPREFRLYRMLIHARYRWSIIISDVRMLIASRLGSYGMDSMTIEEHDIELYLADFRTSMQKLKSMQHAPEAGFQTSIAIDEINKQYKSWYHNYQKLIDIHNSNKWRSDSIQLHDSVNPLLESIWSELLSFDASLEHNAENDINMLGNLAQQQGLMIWLIGLVGLVFVVLGYIGFDRAVLKPMLMLGQAFLQEARNGTNVVDLPKPGSTETYNLIRAFREMRNQIHSRQQALEHQAQHDDLTGLANRNLLMQQLSQLVEQNKRHTDNISLIVLDLDRFKEANDALGHHIGDQLLIEVGRRLRSELRDKDLVARLGGDEFAILLKDAEQHQARKVCKKILKSFEQAFDIQDKQLYVGASLGIAVHPQHGHDAETMMKRADIAMYVAKRNHLGFAFYEANTDHYDMRYLSLAHDLREALIDGALTLAYQLKYDINSNQPVGAEALVRWDHPELGEISPVNIIPLAEQLGIINRLTSWVLKQAIAQCAEWRKQGIFMNMAVNLSVYDLLSTDLIDQISELLEQHEVPASYIVVEVTENAMLIDPNNAISILQRLDSMGLRIAIDDFGAGFSSLGYLKKLPVDELKIDKSFVMDMINNDNDAVIVRSTIDLAHNLGLKVVAEGVESDEIYEMLRILRCDTAQGFYLSEPESPAKIASLLAEIQLQPEWPRKHG